MDTAIPSFILGYHGCDCELAEKIFAGKDTLGRSENDYDWLGNGIDLVNRKLDCAVIQTLHARRKQNDQPAFDTVRAAFFEGKQLYPNAGFASKSHIQICVRNHSNIVGYFRPLNEKGKPISFS